MNKIQITYFIVSLCITVDISFHHNACASSEKVDDKEWIQIKQEEQIIGYEREVVDSKYIESRVIAMVDASVNEVFELLNDVSAYKEWMYECTGAKLLRQEGKFKKLIYYSQGSPLGSPDRDVVMLAKTEQINNNDRYVISLQSINNHPYKPQDLDVESNRIRMDEFKGEWILELINDSLTKVTYTIYSEPGGFAPAFVANNFTRKISFQTLIRMSNMVKKEDN
jgi:hypothetical protein